MWPVPFRSGRHWPCRLFLGVVCVATAAAAAGTVGEREASSPDVPAAPLRRLHASAGWGTPAASASAAFYLSKAHEIIALDAVTGAERWRRSLRGGDGPTAGVRVTLVGDTVVAGDGEVFAFDAGTGVTRWRYGETEALPGRFVGDVAGGALLLGSTEGEVTAVDAARGTMRWRQTLARGRVTVFAPVVAGERVLASFTDFDRLPRSGGVAALRARDGEVQWIHRFPSTRPPLAASASGSPAVAGDLVIASATDGTVYALSSDRGEPRWTLPPIARAGSDQRYEDVRLAAVGESTVLVTSLSGELVAVDPATGRERWRLASPPDGSLGFGLTVHGASAFMPFASGRLLAVEFGTGRPRWAPAVALRAGDAGHKQGPAPRFDWPPAVEGGRVFATAEDGLYEWSMDSEVGHRGHDGGELRFARGALQSVRRLLGWHAGG